MHIVSLYLFCILQIMIKVAINGYGRIGRVAHRVILQKHNNDIDVVAINRVPQQICKDGCIFLKYDK